jgi:hypothetical protein
MFITYKYVYILGGEYIDISCFIPLFLISSRDTQPTFKVLTKKNIERYPVHNQCINKSEY